MHSSAFTLRKFGVASHRVEESQVLGFLGTISGMTTEGEMIAWWKGLDFHDRSMILAEWPRTHGLPEEVFKRLPEKHRGDQESADRWAWVTCSTEFAAFLHKVVEEPFRHDSDSSDSAT